MTMDFTDLMPAVIIFFAIAGVAMVLALSTLAMLVAEFRRRPRTVANTATRPAAHLAAVATRRAA